MQYLLINIIGCGGHSKVVLDALLTNTPTAFVNFWDDNIHLNKTEIVGFPVHAPINAANIAGLTHLALGDNKIREKVFLEIGDNITLHTIIHPRAVISARAEVQAGAFIGAQAILAPDCKIGRGCIINHGAIVDHDVIVDDFAHIAPNSTLGGKVIVERGVLVGSGATILPGVKIGSYAVIGSNAVVTRDVSANQVIKGVPAR